MEGDTHLAIFQSRSGRIPSFVLEEDIETSYGTGGNGGKSLMHRIVNDDDGDDNNAALVAEERYCSVVLLRCIGCGVIKGYEMGASDYQPELSRFFIGQTSLGRQYLRCICLLL
jgi:hypothetical protein